MKCRTCGYALWNLKDRLCPECGSPWKPSDYDLVPSSVRFCCPHCLQDYYGTDERGHLIPRTFPCLKCAQTVDMDEMIVLPTAGVHEDQTGLGRMPWLERGPDASWLGARWFKTVLRALGTPGRLMRVTPPSSSPGSAVGFAFTTMLIVSLLSAAPFLVLFVIGAGAGGVLGIFSSGIFILIGLVAPIVLLLVWAVITHALLWVTGSTSKGIGRTLQALGYSSGVNTIAAVPCLGVYLSPIAWVWWMVSGTVMVREGQKVSGLRATFAVVTPPLVLAAVATAWVFLGVVPTVRRTMAAVQTQVAQAIRTVHHMHAQEISGKLRELATAGAYPRHAAELIANKGVMPQSFLTDGSVSAGGMSIGGTALDDLAFLQGDEREQALTSVLAGVPTDLVAYRLGDYIFTYPGLDPADTSGTFWVFIAEVPPEQAGFVGSPPAAATAPLWLVGLNDGSIQEIADADFPAALAVQNLQRQTIGLPELPDPGTITGWHRAVPPKPDEPGTP